MDVTAAVAGEGSKVGRLPTRPLPSLKQACLHAWLCSSQSMARDSPRAMHWPRNPAVGVSMYCRMWEAAFMHLPMLVRTPWKVGGTAKA